MSIEAGARISQQDSVFRARPSRELTPVVESNGKENTRNAVLFVIPSFAAQTYYGRTMGPLQQGSELVNTHKLSVQDFPRFVKDPNNFLHNINDWHILDLNIVDAEKREKVLRRKLAEREWAFVGVSLLSLQHDEAMRASKIAHEELARFGDRIEKTTDDPLDYTPIVAYGPGVADAQMNAHLHPEVDFWVIGNEFTEPFDTTLRIANLIKRGRITDLGERVSIPGVVTLDSRLGKDDPNYVVRTTTLPIPIFPMDFYFENIERRGPHDSSKYDMEIFAIRDEADNIVRMRKTAQVYTQVSCARACVYCEQSMKHGEDAAKDRLINVHKLTPKEAFERAKRSIPSIMREVASLFKQGCEAIYFDDSTFTEDRPKTIRLLQNLIRFRKFTEEKYGYSLVYGMNTRIDTLDLELITLLKEAGFVYEFNGLESASDAVIAAIAKTSGRQNPYYEPYPKINPGESGFEWELRKASVYLEKADKLYEMLAHMGIPFSIFLIMGAPKLIVEKFRKRQADGTFKEEVFGKYVPADIEQDDKMSISKVIWKYQPTYLSMNVMRFIPESPISWDPRFRDYRGGRDFHGAHYDKDWLEETGDYFATANHPIFMAYESAGNRYPQPPHMTPRVAYELLEHAVNEVNAFFEHTKAQDGVGKKITIVVDKEFGERFLRRNESGIYHLASFEELEEAARTQRAQDMEKIMAQFDEMRLNPKLREDIKQALINADDAAIEQLRRRALQSL